MKSTPYIIEITTQKNEKYLPRDKSTCLLAYSPACLFSTKKFSAWVLTNQATRFISCGIGCSYFSRNFLLSFLLQYDFKILVKSSVGGTFLCLASFVNVWQFFFCFFLIWKLNILSFIFLIWEEQFWMLFSQKLTKNMSKFLSFFKSFSLFYPLYDFWILVQIYQSTI